MDDNTAYLFKDADATQKQGEEGNIDDDEASRDVLSQMKATKDLLTEAQRIAYVGVARLAMLQMVEDVHRLDRTKGSKKQIELAVEAMRSLALRMVGRLYTHMELDRAGELSVGLDKLEPTDSEHRASHDRATG